MLKLTEELKKYLYNGFIPDVFDKIHRIPVEMTSDCVWGKEIKLPFCQNGKIDVDSLEIEPWLIKLDLSNYNDIDSLIEDTALKIFDYEITKASEVEPTCNYEDMKIFQLCDWTVVDTDIDPLLIQRFNEIYIQKCAKIVNMVKYKNWVEDALKLEGETSNLTVNDSPLETIEFADVATEEAYKEGIRNALDWLMEPQNEWEKDESGNQTYIISRCEIEEFAKMKGIK